MSRARDIANYGDGIDTSSITSGTFADARIAQSNVTQHESAIDALASNPTITLGSNATGFTGVKIFDQWRLHSNFTGVGNPISTNLERVDTGNQATIGSQMTPASGIFEFPMTGIYYLQFHSTYSLSYAGGDARYIGMSINKVISGSADFLALTYTGIANAQSSTTYASAHLDTTFDCTDTSTDKVSFSTYELSNNNVYTLGHTSFNYTYMTFIRLGDT